MRAQTDTLDDTQTARPLRRALLSVDVEDYFQVEAFAASVKRCDWGTYPSRVVANTERLLDLFEEYGARATFFFLGWVAERWPELVRKAAARGHEIGCHSYWHRPIFSLTPESFRADTRQALQAIEDAGGTAVQGYRAPTWSITRQSLWALDILAEEGFRYDSSIFPVRHDLYGVPGARCEPYVMRTAAGPLLEIPPATLRIGRLVLPAAGGGYLRIFPLAYSRAAIRRTIACGDLPRLYLHPWEIDGDQPRLAGPRRSRFRHYTGLRTTERKLRSLLRDYRFVPFGESWRSLSVSSPSVPSLAPAWQSDPA